MDTKNPSSFVLGPPRVARGEGGCFLRRVEVTAPYISVYFISCSRELREKKGVSARDMSLSIGQSESYINTIENRKSLPSMMAFFYICEYLGVTPTEFFDDETKNPTLLNKLINELRGLDDDLLHSILSIVEELRTKN